MYTHILDMQCITNSCKPYQEPPLSDITFGFTSVVHTTLILILLATGNHSVWMRSGFRSFGICIEFREFMPFGPVDVTGAGTCTE
jgi:hypothetical protein